MEKLLFQGLEHIGVKTYDMNLGIQFYTEVLGFELINRVKPGKTELAFLKLGEMVIELVEVVDGTEFKDGVVNHIALRVQDIFKAVEWLKEKGVELLQEEPMAMGNGRYNFFFRGPSGEKLELFQGPEF